MTGGSVVEDVLPRHAVPRAALVARLVELDTRDALTAARVRAGAQVAGVHQRTVWRWLGHARTHGAVDRLPRRRFEIDAPGWAVLAQAGGNVAVLHRHPTDTTADPDAVPSPSTLHRVVRRDREAGRELPSRRVLAPVREVERARDALADLALDRPGTDPPAHTTPASLADTPHAARSPSRPGPADTPIATDTRPASPTPALPPTAVVVPTTAVAAAAATTEPPSPPPASPASTPAAARPSRSTPPWPKPLTRTRHGSAPRCIPPSPSSAAPCSRPSPFPAVSPTARRPSTPP